MFVHPFAYIFRRYRRTTKLILYSFYKNMVVSFAQLWFGAHSQMSGLEVYESLMMSTVNLFWSSWPILVIAAFDRDATNDELHAYGNDCIFYSLTYLLPH